MCVERILRDDELWMMKYVHLRANVTFDLLGIPIGWYLILVIRENTCDWHSRGGSATYDIMHNGGYVTLPTMMGNRRNRIGLVSRPTTILFPHRGYTCHVTWHTWHYVVHSPCDLAYIWYLMDTSHVTWHTLDTRWILTMWLGTRLM